MESFNYNGKIYKKDTAVIGANSRGLRFGDGLFETMKYADNKLQFADDHFARLWKGMSLLQFKIPIHFTAENFQKQIRKLLDKNGHNSSARIRLTFFRGHGGLYDETDHLPNYLIQSWGLPVDSGKWNSNGLQLGVYHEARKSCDILSNLKHNNFLPYAMAALYAKQQKWNDAVLLNQHGRICDSTIANIFLVKDEVVHTPSLDEGCIEGILRKNLLAHLSKDNWKIVEGEISVDNLLDADEVFLTNSIHPIRWVQGIGDKKYGNSLVQKIYATFLPTIS